MNKKISFIFKILLSAAVIVNLILTIVLIKMNKKIQNDLYYIDRDISSIDNNIDDIEKTISDIEDDVYYIKHYLY